MALIMDGMRHGRSDLVQRGYFLPRLMRCMVDRKYSFSIGWLGQFMLYLLQLDDAVRLAASPSADVVQVRETYVRARVKSPPLKKQI